MKCDESPSIVCVIYLHSARTDDLPKRFWRYFISSLSCCFVSRRAPCQTQSMTPSKPWMKSQATQNNPRVRKRHISRECNKSSLPVCDIDLHSARIVNFSQAIRATDLTLGLRRIPAGFHVVVKTDGAEFQTSNKLVHVDQAVIEWNESILLYVISNLIFHTRIEKDPRPCEPYSTVRVSVYASFESSPMLCHGEVLRTFEISVRELLDRSENSHRQ